MVLYLKRALAILTNIT